MTATHIIFHLKANSFNYIIQNSQGGQTMISVTIKAVQDLSMQRLLEELGMCQCLCDTMDKKLGAYMTILGRMGTLKVMQRIADLPEVHRAPVFKKWADEMQWYGPWTLLREKTKTLPEKDNLQVFLNKNSNRMLLPGFPWGVLTLGGLMRAYAEMSEMIYDKVKDEGVLRLMKKDFGVFSTGTSAPYTDPKGKPLPSAVRKTGWQQQRIMEDQGRLSWQRNLIEMYGYDLFKKSQVEPIGLSDEEKKQLRQEQQDKLKQQRIEDARQKLDKVTADFAPTEDRMRFVRDIKSVKGAEGWLATYKSLAPSWTKAGRAKWQTTLLDRISLIGDLYGLVRGATISGTTSDHAYSFWQLCDDIRTMNKAEAGEIYAILTRGSTKIALGADAWANHSTNTLKAAFDTMQTEDGFARVLRMMMLVPVGQMGVEMHHSVHEMASVIGLNDMINWRVGYYDTLFMTLKELKALEEKYLAKYRKLAKTPGTGFSKPQLKNTGNLESVENAIKALLQETTKKVFHGFFVTQDPFVVDIDAGDWGGVVMKETRHSSAHRDAALLDQGTMKALNAKVKARQIGATGINKQYIQEEMLAKGSLKFVLGEKPKPVSDVDTLYEELLGRANRIQYKKELQTSVAIKNGNKLLWQRYMGACMVSDLG